MKPYIPALGIAGIVLVAFTTWHFINPETDDLTPDPVPAPTQTNVQPEEKPAQTNTATIDTSSQPQIPTSTQKTYTMATVSQHNTATDCWMVIDGAVYDPTSFIPQHPGGDQIVLGCGKDATSLVTGQRKHMKPQAQAIFDAYKIGTLAQ
ncbi:MAG: cytochrome b5-like heme/steroid binding domain-containing protein [Patescibacteria group bacterium]